jgi:hypothetical protein
VKSLKFIGKTMVFEDLEGCMCERQRYKKTSKMRPKSIRNSMKIDTKNMLEKREPKYENSSKK